MRCKFSRKYILLTYFSLVCVFFGILNVWGSDQGESGARVLTQGMSARALGMGEAYVAVADDMQTLYYNPAGLGRLVHQETGLMYNRSLMDTYYGYLGYVSPLFQGTLGASLATFQGGEIELIADDGSSRISNAEQDFVFSLGYGLDLKELFLGVVTKMVYSTLIEEYHARAFAIDVGGLFVSPNEKFTLGVVVQNIGTQLKYSEVGDSLPLSVGIGGTYQVKWNGDYCLLTSLDIVNINILQMHSGIEIAWGEIMKGRIGYKYGYDLESFSFGLGARLGAFQLDYALGLMGELGMKHYLSLNIHGPENKKR
ncbi:PorV/PorQ family protein [bacterium]|nr:PorV/PorQ family protein [bacterium]